MDEGGAAHKRITRRSLCEWKEVPNLDHVYWDGRWCKLTKDTALLELYDGRTRTMIAERIVFELDGPIFLVIAIAWFATAEATAR